jgi:hypothetical protein
VALGDLPHALAGRADPGERAAQPVGGIREQPGLVGDESLDAPRRVVEGARQLGDLVMAFDARAHAHAQAQREATFARVFDVGLQRLEGPVQAAGEAMGGNAGRECEHGRRHEVGKGAVERIAAGHDPAPVAEGEGEAAGVVAIGIENAAARGGRRGRDGLADPDEGETVLVIDREIELEGGGEGAGPAGQDGEHGQVDLAVSGAVDGGDRPRLRRECARRGCRCCGRRPRGHGRAGAASAGPARAPGPPVWARSARPGAASVRDVPGL